MTATALPAYTPPRPWWWLRTLALLFGDLVSTLVFAAAYALTHAVTYAFAVAMAAGVAGLLWTVARGRRVDAMQVLSLGLTTVFGAAALVTRDPRWVMLKPTLIYAAVGATMLRPGWMVRYVPEVAVEHGAGATRAFGRAWAAAMLGLAAANLALALRGDPRLWAGFLAVAPAAVKAGLGALQYAVTRTVVRRSILARRSPFTGD